MKSKSLTYLEKPIFNQRQLVALIQKTPVEFVRERKGRGGMSFKYTTVSYVQDRLNQIFGWGWSFEVKEHGQSPEGSVWVLGKLTILDQETKQILVTKEQFGSSEYKKDRAGKEIDFADDLKSAASDALKKSASLMGLAADLYATEEVSEEIDKRVKAVVAEIIEKKKEENAEPKPTEIK